LGARTGKPPRPEPARGAFEVASSVLAEFGGKAPKVLTELEQLGEQRLASIECRLRALAKEFARGALGEVQRMRGQALSKLGVAGREQVEDLFRKAATLARRLDEAKRPGFPDAGAGRSTAGP